MSIKINEQIIKETVTVSSEKEIYSKVIFSTVAKFIESSPTEDLAHLTNLLQPVKTSVEEINLAQQIAGNYYTNSPEPIAAILNHQALIERREALLKDCWNINQVMEFLNLEHRSTVGRRRKISLY